MNCQRTDEGKCHLHGSRWPCTTREVLQDISYERAYQFQKYGTNADKPDGTGPETRWLLPYTDASAKQIEADLRRDYEEYEEELGVPSWVHLVREELAEAFLETDPRRLEAELIQVAALCACWVEKIRERREWGVMEDGTGRIITDTEWTCPADIMRSAHGFGLSGPIHVVCRDSVDAEWRTP